MKILTLIIDTAKTAGTVKKSSFKKVIVDTTVACKAVAFPTDATLYLKSLKQLVAFARSEKIALRQTYDRLAPRVHSLVVSYSKNRADKDQSDNVRHIAQQGKMHLSLRSRRKMRYSLENLS